MSRLVCLVVLFGLCLTAQAWKDSEYDFDSESIERVERRHKSAINLEGHDTYNTYKSICMVNGKPTLLNMFDCRNQVGVGRWQNAINSTGWSYLEVETFSGNNEDLQAYSAGYLEGTLSKNVIEYHLQNTYYTYCNGFKSYCKRLGSYLKKNLEYIKGKVESAPKDDLYWQAVRRVFYQLTGVWDGFRGNELNPHILYEITPVYMININGELYDLEKKFNKTKDPLEIHEKCSGFVKVAPNNADLFISQVTMSGFQNLLRVQKLYKFGYESQLFAGHTNTFSSYPAMLYSSDDFALTSAGLAVIETTISVWNNSVFEHIQAEGQLHTWVRAIVANQLARSGREWCKIYSRHNSGTYNNQWVVLDYKRFQPNKELTDYGLLYVLEQLPGKIVYKDETQYLKTNTYYASYNIPFYKEISEMSGFGKKGQEFYWFSWQNCPRANIFRRDHGKVKDLDSLTSLMRYNDYTHEEYSKCNCTPPYTAEAAISARGDLNQKNGTYPLPGMGFVNHGALDYKGTNYELFKQLRFRSIGSPSYEHVPAFDWRISNLAATVKHMGHSELWKFDAVERHWETPNKKNEVLKLDFYYRNPIRDDYAINAYYYENLLGLFIPISVVGKPVLLDVQPSDTIEVLRQKIEEKIGAAAEFQLLTFNGRYLTTDLTAKLSDFGIVKNSTIQLTVRCSGGDWF